MQNLSAFLAFNGAAVLLFSSLVGFALARSLHRGAVSEHWHLLHAGGTSRGVMLLALSAAIPFADLSASSLAWASGLVVLFAWTSVFAMFIRGMTGERGFHPVAVFGPGSARRSGIRRDEAQDCSPREAPFAPEMPDRRRR